MTNPTEKSTTLDRTLTEGPILKALWKLAWPTMLQNIIAGLQGTGDTRSPFYITLISQIVVPIGLCSTLQAIRALQPRDIWLAIVLGHAARATLSFLRFRQGKWKKIKVEIGTATA